MNNTGKKTEVAGSSSTEKPNTTFKNPTTNEDLKALIEILTATLTGKVNQLQVDFQASYQGKRSYQRSLSELRKLD